MDPDLYDRGVAEVAAEDASPVETPPCPVCGARQARPRFDVEGMPSQLVVCRGCGLGRLHPAPGPGEIRGYYPGSYYGEPGRKFRPVVEHLVRLVGSRHARFLARGLPRGARVLDVGCGRGVLLGALADRGLEAHGVELSPEAASGADPRAKIRVAERLADAGYPESFFDEVIVWHVLEHLPDPRETLEEIRRVLRPGGRLVVALPSFGSAQARWAGPHWFHLDVPRHLFHFPLPALRRLLEDVGFLCESEHHFSLRQNPFGWLQSALNRYTDLPRNALYVLLHERAGEDEAPYDPATRRRLRLAWWLGMPAAVAASVLGALFRTGATVHVVARLPERAQGRSAARERAGAAQAG